MIMPPTLKKLEGHIAFGLFARLSVHLFILHTLHRDRILKFYMWNWDGK